MSRYYELFFSKFQHSFRKGFSAQQCLLPMLGKQFWSTPYGAFQGICCLSHDLLIAKLNDAHSVLYSVL